MCGIPNFRVTYYYISLRAYYREISNCAIKKTIGIFVPEIGKGVTKLFLGLTDLTRMGIRKSTKNMTSGGYFNLTLLI